eukprot:CAMPEP_0204427322 /NCGR_PEP_ID=MMETSP0470-20130426/54786_1 /ASSEMBLY_ACC=CAM_ASM_000385 /TAXON_ID=2969 /ORGANISM="Oxyrrhis marina" /LENGTH=71 /DNA_ID=CAMNT_0051425119 /DNA_START=8 /DNA_END=220 /DNA_ORIENTATION=-
MAALGTTSPEIAKAEGPGQTVTSSSSTGRLERAAAFATTGKENGNSKPKRKWCRSPPALKVGRIFALPTKQ